MIALRSCLWGASGETADGYSVQCWRGAYSDTLVVRVNYPAGSEHVAGYAAASSEAAAAAQAEELIREHRAMRLAGATR